MEKILLTLAGLLGAILRSPLFWGAVGGALLLFVLRLIYIHLKLNALEQLEYSRAFSCDGVFPGESLILEEEAHNPTMFPLFGVKLQFFVPEGITVDGTVCKGYTRVTSVFHIPPRARVRKAHSVRADKRGHPRLINASVIYRDSEFNFDAPAELYCYPKYFDADVDMPTELSYIGEYICDRRYIEDPFFFSGIREYRGGDPIRQINFKASARSFSGSFYRIMCNAYDSSRNFNSMVILDLFDYPHESTGTSPVKNKLECGLSYSCYILACTVRQGGAVGFAANCAVGERAHVNIPCDTGEVHVKRILCTMAELSSFSRHDYSVNAMLKDAELTLREGTDVYLITSFTDDRTAEIIRRMSQRGLNVTVIPLVGGEAVDEEAV